MFGGAQAASNLRHQKAWLPTAFATISNFDLIIEAPTAF
jgi:hypothetical protein